MLEQQLYTNEKLREIETQRKDFAQGTLPRAGKPALAPLARPLGRVLHGLGHRMESWATPSPEAEPAKMRLRC